MPGLGSAPPGARSKLTPHRPLVSVQTITSPSPLAARPLSDQVATVIPAFALSDARVSILARWGQRPMAIRPCCRSLDTVALALQTARIATAIPTMMLFHIAVTPAANAKIHGDAIVHSPSTKLTRARTGPAMKMTRTRPIRNISAPTTTLFQTPQVATP